MINDEMMARARRRAAVIDAWACFGHLNRCREPGCLCAPACVVVYRIGDELGVTTLCVEHEVAAKEALRERPRMQLEQSYHDALARTVMPGDWPKRTQGGPDADS